MRKLFKSDFKITQKFGINKEYYSRFGLNGHEGIDLIPEGSDWTIYALEDGVVVKDDDVAGSPLADPYGKFVTIWHKSLNKATQYCHLEFNLVDLGQTVKKGQVIGRMGSTGNTNGAHVHLNLFETDINGIRLNKNNGFNGGIDPLPFLNEGGASMNDLDRKGLVELDNTIIMLNKKSILNSNRREDWIDGKLVARLEDHLNNQDTTIKRLEEKVKTLENQNQDSMKLAQAKIKAQEIVDL